MSEPLDILEIASDRVYYAAEAIQNALARQACAAAAHAYLVAKRSHDLASRDLESVLG